jgi:uncharacterized membrane protein
MVDATKFQANFKLADGTLINIYADSAQDFEQQLATTQDLATLIHSVSQSLGSAGPARAFQPRTSAPTAPAQASAPAQAEGANECKHGPMTFRSGVNAQGKAWKGYMCPAPKGTPDQCKPIFLR